MVHVIVLCTLFVVLARIIFDTIGMRVPVASLFGLTVALVTSSTFFGNTMLVSASARQLFFQMGLTIGIVLLLASTSRGKEPDGVYLGTQDLPRFICRFYKTSFRVMLVANILFIFIGGNFVVALAGITGVVLAKCIIRYYCNS